MKHYCYHACMDNRWTTLPSQETLNQSVTNLSANGFNPILVSTEEEAKEKVFELLPQGTEVLTMTSITLQELGIVQEINESGKFDAVRPKLMKMDRATQGREMRKLGTAPDWAIGSVHAVTQDGHVMIASRTGSQLPAYVYGAGHVIWVVGAQKVVKDIEEGKKRIFEHTLLLESERANKAYNITTGSKVDKLLTFYQEETPNRITLILANQVLGF